MGKKKGEEKLIEREDKNPVNSTTDHIVANNDHREPHKNKVQLVKKGENIIQRFIKPNVSITESINKYKNVEDTTDEMEEKKTKKKDTQQTRLMIVIIIVFVIMEYEQ